MIVFVPLLIGIALLLIVIYIGFKILKNVLLGIVLIVLVAIASFLILGYVPSPRDIPIIGQFFPSIPTTPEGVVIAIKDILHNINIVDVNRDSQNNLLIAVANTGKQSVSGLKVFVDNQTAGILNSIKDPLGSGEVTIIQTNWKGNFTSILIQTNEANATFAP